MDYMFKKGDKVIVNIPEELHINYSTWAKDEFGGEHYVRIRHNIRKHGKEMYIAGRRGSMYALRDTPPRRGYKHKSHTDELMPGPWLYTIGSEQHVTMMKEQSKRDFWKEAGDRFGSKGPSFAI